MNFYAFLIIFNGSMGKKAQANKLCRVTSGSMKGNQRQIQTNAMHSTDKTQVTFGSGLNLYLVLNKS